MPPAYSFSDPTVFNIHHLKCMHPFSVIYTCKLIYLFRILHPYLSYQSLCISFSRTSGFINCRKIFPISIHTLMQQPIVFQIYSITSTVYVPVANILILLLDKAKIRTATFHSPNLLFHTIFYKQQCLHLFYYLIRSSTTLHAGSVSFIVLPFTSYASNAASFTFSGSSNVLCACISLFVTIVDSITS